MSYRDEANFIVLEQLQGFFLKLCLLGKNIAFQRFSDGQSEERPGPDRGETGLGRQGPEAQTAVSPQLGNAEQGEQLVSAGGCGESRQSQR